MDRLSDKQKEELYQLFSSGQKLKAIKYLMEIGKHSLADVSELINKQKQTSSATDSTITTATRSLSVKDQRIVMEYLDTNKKTEAIAHVRQVVGCNLVEAKELVDSFKEVSGSTNQAKQNSTSNNEDLAKQVAKMKSRGNIGQFIFILLIALLIAFFVAINF